MSARTKNNRFLLMSTIVEQQLHEFEVRFNGEMYGDFLIREGVKGGGRGGGEEREGRVYVLFRSS